MPLVSPRRSRKRGFQTTAAQHSNQTGLFENDLNGGVRRVLDEAERSREPLDDERGAQLRVRNRDSGGKHREPHGRDTDGKADQDD